MKEPGDRECLYPFSSEDDKGGGGLQLPCPDATDFERRSEGWMKLSTERGEHEEHEEQEREVEDVSNERGGKERRGGTRLFAAEEEVDRKLSTVSGMGEHGHVRTEHHRDTTLPDSNSSLDHPYVLARLASWARSAYAGNAPALVTIMQAVGLDSLDDIQTFQSTLRCHHPRHPRPVFHQQRAQNRTHRTQRTHLTHLTHHKGANPESDEPRGSGSQRGSLRRGNRSRQKK